MSQIDTDAQAQRWISENWSAGKSDYQNSEDMLIKLQRWEERERGTGSEAYKLIGKLYERVQVIREVALGGA